MDTFLLIFLYIVCNVELNNVCTACLFLNLYEAKMRKMYRDSELFVVADRELQILVSLLTTVQKRLTSLTIPFLPGE